MKKLILLSIMLVVGCEEPDKYGCLDGKAANYDATASINNNTCTYIDSCGVIDIDKTNDCVQDECGVWGGNNSPNTGICDCFGLPNGEASLDCANECNGAAVEDNCGTCDTNPYNDCFQDCDGNWLTRNQSCEYRLGWGDSCDILNPVNSCEGGCDDYCDGSDCVAVGLCLPNSILPPTFNCQCVCGESLPDYLPESIGDCNFMEIINEDTISDECRNIVEDYLPSENILPDLTSPIGKGLINGNPVLFIMGSDILGTSLDLNTSEITIASSANSIIDTLTESDYNLKTIQDYVDDIGNIISLSSIIDYSGSMGSDDIDDAVEIYSDIFTVFNPLFESEIRLFSNCVIRKVDFTSSQSILLDKIERDERIDRRSTSLFDAIGEGLSALSTRDGLIKLLIVSTDGLENSSITYSDENEIIDFAKQSEIPIIFFGTLFSDVTFMREISEETNGLFIFNSTFKSIKNDALVLYDMLSNIQAIEITGEDWTNVTSFQVTIDGKTLVFNLD